MKRPPLRSFRVENFKAIRDSGRVEFGWLTAFIGNNGIGKSSFIEGLETFADITDEGVDAAFRRWRGFEHVRNMANEHRVRQTAGNRVGQTNPMRFRLDWRGLGDVILFEQAVTLGKGGNSLFIAHELLKRWILSRPSRYMRDAFGKVTAPGAPAGLRFPKLADGESLLSRQAPQTVTEWQFLMLNPDQMGQPTPQQRAGSKVHLAKDGSNVAQYLNEIRELDVEAFNGLVEALRYVLPYAADLQPSLTLELERAFYLRLKEGAFEVPGWLLSTGTLRIVALLACLRHPNPPRLLVVEEIENGLDPRTLHLLVEEIRAAITAGTTQVILTTHSPYLLDLLDLSHIIVVEREDGQPVFRRPDATRLAEWSKSFAPGRLYTMGRLKGDA